MSQSPAASSDVERAVRERYGAAAERREEALCCPVVYEPRYLDAIPKEVLERDYGCGDPSRYVRSGDRVLDLGSGGGKICFIASQIVGSEGQVIGVDMNDSMLALARESSPAVARNIGYSNVSFRKGRIQDLSLDQEAVDVWLRENPVGCAADLLAFEEACDALRREKPLVPDGSVDVVISNCVLNLVRDRDKGQLIEEIFRVLAVGGRIAISDIVSDEIVPESLRADPELWSGCISGAFHERDLLHRLEEAGFYGIALESWEEKPFATVEGIEFRSVTVTGRKGKEGPCYEANQAVLYSGPWKRVEDDDGHVLERGERTAVCEKTYRILTSEPYAEQTIAVPPRVPMPAEDRLLFDCSRTEPRHPRESKGTDYDETRPAEPETSCC